MEFKKPIPLRVSQLQREGSLTPYYFPPHRGRSALLQLPKFILTLFGTLAETHLVSALSWPRPYKAKSKGPAATSPLRHLTA